MWFTRTDAHRYVSVEAGAGEVGIAELDPPAGRVTLLDGRVVDCRPAPRGGAILTLLAAAPVDGPVVVMRLVPSATVDVPAAKTANTWWSRSPRSSPRCSTRVPQCACSPPAERPLGLDGEVVRVLDPLPEADAVTLFAQRAAERRPSFVITADTAADVAQLCRALDCLPLAIELAAARARILTVPEIARRIDDRFTLLSDPTSARPERRRTLSAALSWSYDLLFPDDQRGLWALAWFPGGATLSSFEHVLAALDVPAASAIDVVERLVDRSLVTVDLVHDGATRYRLLDSVRAFADVK